MRRRSFAILFAIVCVRTVSAAPAAVRVDYTLAPTLARGQLQDFVVTVRFPADRSGVTGFGWLDHWRDDHQLSRFVRDLQVDGARSATQDRPGHWRIVSPASAPLTVRYRIVAGSAPGSDPSTFERSAPIIHGETFSALGMVLFGRPDGSEKTPATFAWQAGPTHVPLVSDLQHLPAPGPATAHTGTTGDVLMSTLVGGAGVTTETPVATKSEPRVGLLPGSVAQPAAFVASVRRIVPAERTFWNEHDPGPYTVTATTVPSSYAGFLSGAGFGDSFALWTNAQSSNAALAFFIAHENFHTWNPAQLGKDYPDLAAQQRAAWLDEGFTDYFGQALSLHSGAVTVEDFRDIWNDALLEYANSPWRNATNATLAPAFFKDQEAKRMPYLRGAMLAARWNALLRQRQADTPGAAAVDLRSILLDQRAMARTSAAVPTELFIEAAARHGLDVKDDLDRFVEQGQTLVLAPDTFGPCAHVVTQQRPRYATGYTAKPTPEGRRVTALEPGSNADRAGLRVGMLVAKVTGHPGDSLAPYRLDVLDGSTHRSIAFLPQGKGTVSVQQLQLVTPAPGHCAASLAGIRSLP